MVAKQAGELVERDLRVRRAAELAGEVELVAEQDEALVGQGLREVEAQELALRQEIVGIVVGEQSSGAAILERVVEELEAGDALACAWRPAEDVGPARQYSAEPVVEGLDTAFHEHGRLTFD